MAEKTVGKVANLSGVSVRTLHHYDNIGLLSPTERSESGYRLYAEGDLVRLQEILLWRSFGFPLEEIRALLTDPSRDRMEALALQRQKLVEEVGAIHERIAALDAVIQKQRTGEAMDEVDFVALFDGFDPAEYEEEAEQLWGGTDAWAESRRRTKSYGAREWEAIKVEMNALNERFAALLRAGAAPDTSAALEAARDHRLHIQRWFYDCPPEVHQGLGDMYVADDRFKATYEAVAPGLADFVQQAIRALYAPRRRTL